MSLSNAVTGLLLDQTELSTFRNVTCGTDGTMTICQNSFDQGGFVISPAGSFIMDPSNPLLQDGGGRSPFAN